MVKKPISKFPCTFRCSKVTSEEKDVAYILKSIGNSTGSGVFSSHTSDDVTLALKTSSDNVYSG